jgi:hypothetical protein
MDHNKNEIIKSPKNQIVETIIQSFLPDLFQDLNKKLDLVNNSLKGFSNLIFFSIIIKLISLILIKKIRGKYNG